MDEFKVKYYDDVIQLSDIITRYKNIKENDISCAFYLMQDSLQSYYRWSKIRADVRKGLKRGESAELKDYLENIPNKENLCLKIFSQKQSQKCHI